MIILFYVIIINKILQNTENIALNPIISNISNLNSINSNLIEHINLSVIDETSINGWLSAGGYHNCYILGKSGKLVCWGSNRYGQINVHSKLHTDTVQVSTGAFHSCALQPDQVACWGRNDYSQCTIPDSIEQGLFWISAGWLTTCAIQRSEKIFCWGDCSDGMCEPPVKQNSNVSRVETGWGHSCAIAPFHKVFCYGWNTEGQSDVPDYISLSNLQDKIIDNIKEQEEAGARGNSDDVCSEDQKEKDEFVHKFCKNIIDNAVDNSARSKTDRPSPSPQPPSPSKPSPSPDSSLIAIELSTGQAHTCALVASKRVTIGVRCWGNNFWKQNSPPSFLTPSLLHSLTTGARHSCILARDSLKCWGSSGECQCNIPPSLDNNVAFAAAGYYHTCAVSLEDDLETNTMKFYVKCIGSDEQLCDGTSKLSDFFFQNDDQRYVSNNKKNGSNRRKHSANAGAGGIAGAGEIEGEKGWIRKGAKGGVD